MLQRTPMLLARWGRAKAIQIQSQLLVVTTSQVRKTPTALAQKLGQPQPFSSCVPAGMYGPACIVWAKLTPFSLQARIR